MVTLEVNSLATLLTSHSTMKKDRIILTDVDGVLLDWEFAFHTWMEEHGHTAEDGHKLVYSVAKRFGITGKNAKKLTEFFNESASIGFLPPLRDAMFYVKKLHRYYNTEVEHRCVHSNFCSNRCFQVFCLIFYYRILKPNLLIHDFVSKFYIICLPLWYQKYFLHHI